MAAEPKRNGIKVHWHSTAIRCAVKSWGRKCLLGLLAAERIKQSGTFGGSGVDISLRLTMFMWGFGEAWLRGKTNHFAWFPGLSTNGREPSKPGRFSPPKQFRVFTRLRKCGGSKITAISWNSEGWLCVAHLSAWCLRNKERGALNYHRVSRRRPRSLGKGVGQW